MLKPRIPLIALFAASCLGFATPSRAAVSIGFKGGISVSQITSDILDPKWRTGFGGGVSLGIGLTPNLEFMPELLYVRKGAELFASSVTWGGVTFGNIRTTFDLDYLEIPLLLKLKLVPAGPLQLHVLGGPTVAFKTAEKLATSGLASFNLNSDQIKTSDYGLMLGAGFAIPFGGMNLTLDGRYTWGLANVSDLPFGGALKNTDALVMAGLEFPFGK